MWASKERLGLWKIQNGVRGSVPRTPDPDLNTQLFVLLGGQARRAGQGLGGETGQELCTNAVQMGSRLQRQGQAQRAVGVHSGPHMASDQSHWRPGESERMECSPSPETLFCLSLGRLC